MDQRSTPTVSVTSPAESEMVVAIGGRLEVTNLSNVWKDAISPVKSKVPSKLTVNLDDLTYCDGIAIGLLTEMDAIVRAAGGEVTFSGASDDLKRMLDMALLKDPDAVFNLQGERQGMVEQVGRATASLFEDIYDLLAWIGELTLALLWGVRNPHRIRWKDTFAIAEKAGVDATPVVCLLGFIIGLIIAFQSAGPMKSLGAESLVPTLVGFSIIRELGPLIAAIILAGRSGSAFAAEIGTMKVTEELDALTTMGLNPTRFLVLPRVIAALIMTPMLSLFSTLMGMAGGYLVMASMGYSLSFYIDQITSVVGVVDFVQGVCKMFVFAMLIAAIGCLRGLRTQSGPGAVGDSATAAVVAGIVLVVLADGILGVVFYYVGI